MEAKPTPTPARRRVFPEGHRRHRKKPLFLPAAATSPALPRLPPPPEASPTSPGSRLPSPPSAAPTSPPANRQAPALLPSSVPLLPTARHPPAGPPIADSLMDALHEAERKEEERLSVLPDQKTEWVRLPVRPDEQTDWAPLPVLPDEQAEWQRLWLRQELPEQTEWDLMVDRCNGA